MISMGSRRVLVWSATLLTFAGAARADDWTNSGANSGRNSLTTGRGPDAAHPLWSGGRNSLIAWQPVIEGSQVFMVRQTGWPTQEPNKSPVVAMNLNTGAEAWLAHVPFYTGNWTTWVAGVKNSRVFAARSGNGASVAAQLYCLDVTDGHILWFSNDTTRAGPYDGVVFAPDGDPIIADFYDLKRFDALDGSTVWSHPRTGSVSGNCGAALHSDAVYVVDTTAGGNIVVRHDLATGVEQYASSLMPGFTVQNTPMVGPDGTVYVSRTQNNPSVDYFYAFEDTGLTLVEKWSVPAAWSTSSEFAVGPDGSVYMLGPGGTIHRLDPSDGHTLSQTESPIGGDGPRMACDADGRLFVSNGGFADGRLYSFNADLTERWSVAVANINIGGPALGQRGTLIVCGAGTDVRAYRTSLGDLNCNGVVDFGDIDPFVLAISDPAYYQQQYPDCDLLNADCNEDGLANFDDVNPFVDILTAR